MFLRTSAHCRHRSDSVSAYTRHPLFVAYSSGLSGELAVPGKEKFAAPQIERENLRRFDKPPHMLSRALSRPLFLLTSRFAVPVRRRLASEDTVGIIVAIVLVGHLGLAQPGIPDAVEFGKTQGAQIKIFLAEKGVLHGRGPFMFMQLNG